MRASAVRKLYRDVDGDERFRLVALALSRGDVREAEHLLEGPPRVPVLSRDLDLVEAHRRFVALQSRFDRAASPLLGWLVLLDLIEPLAANLIGEADSVQARSYAALLRAYLDEARRRALSQVKGLLQVLDEVGTEQLGLAGEVILAVPILGCAALLQRYREAIEGVEVDPEDLGSLRAELEWPRSKEGALDAVS